jgi:hypothetical protein
MDQSLERWVPVEGYEGLYEVSDMGRIRSVDGLRWNGCKWHRFKGRLLKQSGSPYKQVTLSKERSVKTYKVHTLVAAAFLPPCPGKIGKTAESFHVDHINDDKLDNRAVNLQWLTLVNNTYRKNPKSICKLRGEMHPNAKYSEDLIRIVKYSNHSASEISKECNVPRDYVYSIRNGMAWKHV